MGFKQEKNESLKHNCVMGSCTDIGQTEYLKFIMHL